MEDGTVGPSAAAIKRFAQAARGVSESQPALTHPSGAFSPSQSVRCLSAVAAAPPGKLLMALDCDDGEPKFHQLEPDRQMVAGAG
jgi:hypothetical protein